MTKIIQTGFRLRPDALKVPRHQTDQLCEWLCEGGLVHLVGSRQVGKSTLADTVVSKLIRENRARHSATIDFDGAVDIGSGLEFQQICSKLALALGLERRYHQWKETAEAGGGKSLWVRFLEEFLLSHLEGRIVLVFDEIDTLANRRRAPGSPSDEDRAVFGFNDDFLLALRSLHNAAAAHATLLRLSFCLVGTRPPAWLVSNPKRTRMNVGKTLVLKDFTSEEAAGFLPNLEPVTGRPTALLDEVLAWTAGHPLFTAQIVHALEQGGRVPLRGERGAVQAIVDRLYFDDGISNHNALLDTEERIKEDEPQAPAARRLETYELVLERGAIDYRAAEPIHLALILDGLLGIEEAEGDRFLVPRNEISRRVFDLDWVRAMRKGALYWEPSKGDTAPASEALGAVRQAVKELLADAGYYELLDGGVEDLTGILFSFAVATTGRVRKPLRLQVYRGLTGVAVELWEQEVRALERLSGTRSATLPVLHDAGFFEHRDLAFTLTEQASRQLSNPGALDQLRDRPGAALREMLLLAKGLVLLQSQGLVHRNLWGGNIEVIERDDGSSSLRLARFQMSMLLGNMLRRLGEAQPEPVDLDDLDQAVRDFFCAQGREALACAPPERLAFLFNELGMDSLESSAGDIYSLGMIGFQLFVGPFPDDHLMAAFPETPDGKVGFSLGAFREFHREIRVRLQRRGLDKSLRELLGKMIEWKGAARPTIFAVTHTLQADYDIIQRSFEPSLDQKFILSYMPEQMGEQLQNYGWLVHDPKTEQGEDELWELLSQDLRDTTMTFSEQGAAPYVSNPDHRHENAKFVLLGRKATYFGQLFEDRSGIAAGISGVTLPQVFLMTFSCEKKKTSRLSDSRMQRRLPPFRLVSYRDPLIAPHKVRDFPSWTPLLQSVTLIHRSPAQEKFERSLDWLLEVERCEQTIRQYAVFAENRDGTTVLRWDRARDRERIFRNTFQAFYATDRPDFGDFFAQLSKEQSSQLLFEVSRGGESRLASRRNSMRVTFLRQLDPESIQVQVEGELPGRGWLRSEGEVGSIVQWSREVEARNLLSQMPNLISQLIEPRTIVRRPGSWIGAGEGLEGDAAKIIRKMLDTRPFFALQGPPGTGKTTVTARAVALALKHDRSQRILISAQSHYALDHLAKKVLLEMRKAKLSDLPTLRIATESSEGRVEDPEIQALMPKNRVDTLLRRLSNSRPEAALAGRPKLQEIAGRWRKIAASHALEIQDRLRRGANVLFATTGSATAELLGLEAQGGVCDWAIVEEASKASPTELAIPLVQARRWTLIGDHFQLPPFGKEKLEALLRRCLQEADPDIRQHGERFEEHMAAFGLFGNLFKSDTSPAVDRLGLQFRMDRIIGNMVGRTFYQGKLETADSAAHKGLEVKKPASFQGHRLLWVESGPQAREHPSWSNQREVDLVKQLVDSLMKNRPEPTPEQLVVLSPYHHQNDSLRRALGQYANRVHTVDSFQGKEADIVIVSLVRVNRYTSARQRLGFLASANRINVMASRARKLLILVGSYEHFKSSGIPFWEKICAEVVTQGGGVISRWNG